MRTKLSPAFIAAAKCEPGAERSIFWDESLPSFGLIVTGNGAKSFCVQYRANGRSRRIGLKAALSLSDARKEAKAILGRVAKGGDPLAERRKVNAAAANTLQSVCAAYFSREGRKLRTGRDREIILARLVYPSLGARQIDDIRRSEIVRLLDRIEDQNGATMADRTLAYLRRVFSWHSIRSDDFRSPITRGMARTKPAEQARDRILTNDEIRKIWQAAKEMDNAFGPLVQFILLTATRRNEAARMRRDEISGDVWTIPGSRNKGKRDFSLPLSKAAQAILNDLPVIGDGKIVFTHDGGRCIGGFSKFKNEIDEASGVTDWTLHDLRRSARSLMSRAGVDADIAERCLNHAIGGVRATYDRHSYLPEKRFAFEKLATTVEAINSRSIR